MDVVDKDMERAERDASPSRFQQYTEAGEPVERVESSSSSSSSASEGGIRRQDTATGMSRLATQRDNPGVLERNQTAMSRIQTQRSQHNATVGAGLKSRTLRTESRLPLPPFGGGKEYPPVLPDREEYVVEFDGVDDPLHAQNWPMKKKFLTAAMLGYTTFTAAFGSSIFSAATKSVAGHFGVSTEVGVLGVSLYVLGFATGPIIWAPLSELRGRRLPLVIASFGFSIFQVAVAVAKDLQTVMICRFWGGFFGACPLTVVAAVFSDMFNNRQRGLAVCRSILLDKTSG
jgi:DHA1 family multidrug resistance protein-like MFS transporter